jgi:hypothetical protein
MPAYLEFRSLFRPARRSSRGSEGTLDRVASIVAALSTAALLSGCASTQAKTTIAEAPALDAPAPPPRVIAPLDTEETPPQPIAVTEEPVRAPSPRPPARPTPGTARDRSPKGSDVNKPDPANPESKVEAEAAKPPEAAPAEPSPMLQRQPTAKEQAEERAIRDRLTRAERDLSQVDYGPLSSDARNQYDTAKRFIQQANDALKARNFVFAENLADKAATLAASLRSP